MIEVKNLRKEYHDDAGDTVALSNVNFNLPNKGMVFIVGRSGCGKTTLLNILGGLDNFTSGDVLVNKKNLAKFTIRELDDYRNSTIGFVFQDFCLIERLNVIDNIKLSLEFQDSKEDINIEELLKKMDLEGLGNRRPSQLSAGQKQRVAIARAIVKNPEIILADEPTGNVDEKTSSHLLKLLKSISKDKLVVVISHNPDEAYKYADRIIEMDDGTIVSDKSLNILSYEKLYLDDSKAIIPENGKLSHKEVNMINEAIIKSNGEFEIIQSEEKFIEKEPIFEEEEIKLRKVKMNKKTLFKYAKFFFRKKLLFNIFMILLITFVASSFAIIQELGFGDLNYEMSRILADENITETFMYYNTDSFETCEVIDKKMVDEISEKYGKDIYCVYQLNLPLSSLETNFSNGSKVSSLILKNGYSAESNGVCIIDLDGLVNRLNNGNLQVIKGEIKENSSGIIITDYFADCIIHYSTDISSYDDIMNKEVLLNRFKVDAIIKTDYYTKYEEEINDFFNVGKNNDDYLNDSTYKYNYLYTINKNFINDYKQYLKDVNCEYSSTPLLEVSNATTSIEYYGVRCYFDDKLTSNEMHMSYSLYNSIFKTNYSDKNISKFKPIEISIKLYDGSKNVYFDKTFTITNLYTNTIYRDLYHISTEYFDEIYDQEHYVRMLSIDGENMLFDMFMDLKRNYFGMGGRVMNLTLSTIELLSVFKSVFTFFAVIMIGALFFIILLNASTIIRQNVYEIGLMKAFGAKTHELVIIFTLQMLLTSLIVCVLLYSASFSSLLFSNTLLCNGISAYLGTSFKLNVLIMNHYYFTVNILSISSFTIMSIIVPIMTIRKIKPLRIIKTRN